MQTTLKVILSTSFFFFFVKLFLLRAGKFAFSPVPSPTHVIPLYMKLEMLRCSFTKLCLTLHDLMNMSVPGSLSVTVSQSLLRLMPIESVMPSNHLILYHPLLFLPSIFPSIRVFSNESALHIRWPEYWSFSFSISPSNEYSGLIFFRIDWFDLLAVQGNLKSLP